MAVSSQRIRQIAIPYLVSIGIWLAISILIGWQEHYIAWAQKLNTSFFQSLILPGIRSFTFALLTPSIFYVVRRYPISAGRLIGRTIIYLLGSAVFVVCFVCIRWTLVPPWNVATQQFAKRSVHNLVGLVRGGFADQISMYIAIVIAAHAFEYFRRSRDQELERYELQQALATSELQALKAQLHPHFLFNTLHGISTLIDSDRRSAKTMIFKLSNLLRTALQHGSADLISVDEELKFIEAYIDLEKMRLGARLEVRWSIDPETSEALVPQMILQPLVENAILHGIACCREGGWIEIASKRAVDSIELRVRNSVGGRNQPGTGLGLSNVKARLKHLYSDEANLLFTLSEDRIATATVRVPALVANASVKIQVTNSGKLEASEHARVDCG
jgi:hypothetical protein